MFNFNQYVHTRRIRDFTCRVPGRIQCFNVGTDKAMTSGCEFVRVDNMCEKSDIPESVEICPEPKNHVIP